MNDVLRAIVDDDCQAVKAMLKANGELTTRSVREPNLKNTGRGGSGAAVAISAQREIIREFLALGVSPALKNGRGKSVRACVQSAWIRGGAAVIAAERCAASKGGAVAVVIIAVPARLG